VGLARTPQPYSSAVDGPGRAHNLEFRIMPLRQKVLQTDAELFLFGLDRFLTTYQDVLVDGRPYRGSRDIQRIVAQKMGLSSWDWLLHAFGAAAAILQAAGPKKTLREFVDVVIQSVPNQDRSAAFLKDARASLWAINWTNLLDMDCQTCAGLLRETVKKLLAIWDTQELLSESKSDAAYENGQRAYLKKIQTPRLFSFERKTCRFPFRQSLLLECLCENPDEGEAGSSVSVLTAIVHVWSWGPGGNQGSLKQMENRLHQLQNATNKALMRNKIPLKIGRSRPNHLELIQLAREKPKRHLRGR
jgi:hypothetical protein